MLFSSELATINPLARQTTGVFQKEIRVLIEDEPDDLIYDSGIEEEASDSLRRSPNYSEFEARKGPVKCIPLYQTVKKSRNGNISCHDDTKNSGGNYLDNENDNDLAQDEPLYHVLEGPGDDRSGTIPRETGDERAKATSYYQSLMPNYQSETREESLTDSSRHGRREELILSSTGLYQSLTPPTHDNILNNESNVTSDVGLHEEIGNEKETAEPSEGIYQPLLHRYQSHSDRKRSVTVIYEPLRRSPESRAPLVRCWSAPQGSLSQVPPVSLSSENGQGGTEPVYQAVLDEPRCPLNIDDPGSVFPHARRRSPRASPVAQRRTIDEPTYMAVHVRPSRQNRRTCRTEQEPRYSPSPCRKNPSPSNLQPPGSNTPPRGHRRNVSDGGHVLSAVVNSSGAESSSLPADSRHAPSALPRHLGHRRNRSDIGLCPIDRGHVSRRLTSTSDSGIPRRPSLGSLATEYPISASDPTHFRVHIGP